MPSRTIRNTNNTNTGIRKSDETIVRYLTLQRTIELGSFTKAADYPGYTQSSVRQMISSSEKELGIKLLPRSHGVIALTDEGKEIYPFIERTINQYRAMQKKVNRIKALLHRRPVTGLKTEDLIRGEMLPILPQAHPLRNGHLFV